MNGRLRSPARGIALALALAVATVLAVLAWGLFRDVWLWAIVPFAVLGGGLLVARMVRP